MTLTTPQGSATVDQMLGSVRRGVKGAAIIASLVIGACGGNAATPVAPAATPLSAQAIAVQPKDFAGVSLHVCPAPATGTFQTYAGAYRTGISRQPLILAANLAAARADGWAQSLTGAVDTCKGSLGFAIPSDEPGVMSYTFVFPSEADAVAAFPTVGAGTFAPMVRGSQTGFGTNSASWSSPPDSYLIAWQKKTVVALVECDKVATCKSGAMALDSRIH